MKHFIIILFLSFFLKIETQTQKTITIVSSFKKSKTNHRFVLPVFAAIECSATLYTIIPVIIASLGHINFCLPAQPEIELETINKKLILT